MHYTFGKELVKYMPNINSITYSELKQVINSILSDNLIQRMFNISHPIGSLHLSFDDRSPDKYLEGGGLLAGRE